MCETDSHSGVRARWRGLSSPTKVFEVSCSSIQIYTSVNLNHYSRTLFLSLFGLQCQCFNTEEIHCMLPKWNMSNSASKRSQYEKDDDQTFDPR